MKQILAPIPIFAFIFILVAAETLLARTDGLRTPPLGLEAPSLVLDMNSITERMVTEGEEDFRPSPLGRRDPNLTAEENPSLSGENSKRKGGPSIRVGEAHVGVSSRGLKATVYDPLSVSEHLRIPDSRLEMRAGLKEVTVHYKIKLGGRR